MPKFGLGMKEGQIVEWLKKDNAAVKKGEPLLITETKKVEVEVARAASCYRSKDRLRRARWRFGCYHS